MEKENINIWDKIQIIQSSGFFLIQVLSILKFELPIQNPDNGDEMGVSKIATDQFACHFQ